jgi:hypothetical protein
MSGIFTWERDLSKGPLVHRYSGDWYTLQGHPSSIEQNVRLLQSTTSYRSGGGISFKDSVRALSNREIINEAVLNRTKYLTPYDNGHEFETIKHELLMSHRNVYINGGNVSFYGKNSFRGPLSTSRFGSYDDFALAEDLDYVTLGTGFIADTIPTKAMSDPLGDLAQILFGQFKPEAIGASIQTLERRVDVARAAGGEYLNLQFGWAPTISDVADIMKAVQRTVKIVTQYYRDSGRNVRRTRARTINSGIQTLSEYDTERPLNYLSFDSNRPLYAPNGQYGHVVETLSNFHNLKFTANYTYYIPQADSVMGELARYEALSNEVLNHRLTPDLLWQLAPWTWLSDWVVNIGDILTNASALMSDGLVIRYAYLQDESFADHTYSVSGVQFSNWDPGTIETIYRTKRKKRVKSSPYGFGLNPDSFTDQQWAILAALGMSKSPRKLH